jgi:hypothetical protein
MIRMLTTRDTLANQSKAVQTEMAWAEVLAEVLKRGFHGSAAIEVAVQDGTIQHIRRRVERLEK